MCLGSENSFSEPFTTPSTANKVIPAFCTAAPGNDANMSVGFSTSGAVVRGFLPKATPVCIFLLPR